PLVVEYLAGLVVEIVKRRPESLFGREQAAALREEVLQAAGGQAAELEGLAPERLERIGGQGLRQEVGGGGRGASGDLLQGGLGRALGDEDFAEYLIARLRPHDVKIKARRDYLEEVFAPAPPWWWSWWRWAARKLHLAPPQTGPGEGGAPEDPDALLEKL